MTATRAHTALLAALLWVAGCNRPARQAARATPRQESPAPAAPHALWLNGTIQAVRSHVVVVPQIVGQAGRITLTRLIPNGTRVRKGDLLAAFDRTTQLDAARDAQAKYEDLGHQVEQRRAQNRSDAEKRSSDIAKAQAQLDKARIELRKGPLLSEIDRLKNEAKAADAQSHVESLKKSAHFHDLSDAAALRILELQRDRQKVAWDRALANAQRLEVHAPLDGMVALVNTWRNGSMGHAQEGDQMWDGQPLLKIFDPTEMEIRARIGEPDGAAVPEGGNVIVRLDAYPELMFHARFTSASPVAASALGSPIKTFEARFRLEENDPHLLPDLSAAVVVQPQSPATLARGNGRAGRRVPERP